MPSEPFYDPAKSYLDNFEHGPFGLFANTSPAFPDTQPQHEFLGHPVFAPFGIPAGPLINGKFVKAALDMGFDIPVYKTVRTKKYACHPWPNVLAVKVEGDLAPDRMLIASEDLVDLMHLHPFLAGGSTIQYNVIFPRAGNYKVWSQFQRLGVVNTIAFSLRVNDL